MGLATAAEARDVSLVPGRAGGESRAVTATLRLVEPGRERMRHATTVRARTWPIPLMLAFAVHAGVLALLWQPLQGELAAGGDTGLVVAPVVISFAAAGTTPGGSAGADTVDSEMPEPNTAESGAAGPAAEARAAAAIPPAPVPEPDPVAPQAVRAERPRPERPRPDPVEAVTAEPVPAETAPVEPSLTVPPEPVLAEAEPVAPAEAAPVQTALVPPPPPKPEPPALQPPESRSTAAETPAPAAAPAAAVADPEPGEIAPAAGGLPQDGVQSAAISDAAPGGGGLPDAAAARETGSDGGGEGGKSQEISNSYTALLTAWLQKHQEYPSRARRRDQSGAVVVRFTVDRQGRLRDSEVVDSSGYELLDAAALATLERASPLPPMPSRIGGAQFTVAIAMAFVLE